MEKDITVDDTEYIPVINTPLSQEYIDKMNSEMDKFAEEHGYKEDRIND